MEEKLKATDLMDLFYLGAPKVKLQCATPFEVTQIYVSKIPSF
jgi:hypothetical protein